MLFLDIETARLDINAEITWLAGVITTPIPELRIVTSFSQRIHFNPRKADEAALKTFRYDQQDWLTHGVELRDALEMFAAFTLLDKERFTKLDKKGKPYELRRTAAFNAYYDRDRLVNNLTREQVFWKGDISILDVKQLAQWSFHFHPHLLERPKDFSLSSLVSAFGIPVEEELLHDPIYDCRLTIKLLRKLLEVFPLMPQEEKYV